MPSCSMIDLCEFVAARGGQDCPCRFELDDDGPNQPSICSSSSSPSSPLTPPKKLTIRGSSNGDHCDGDEEEGRGSRVPLPWELLQLVLRILGHCLLPPPNPQELRDSALAAVRCVYARASHDLLPQAILASRSLMQLEKSSRKAAKPEAAAMGNSSKPNTATKTKKPEVFVSKMIFVSVAGA